MAEKSLTLGALIPLNTKKFVKRIKTIQDAFETLTEKSETFESTLKYVNNIARKLAKKMTLSKQDSDGNKRKNRKKNQDKKKGKKKDKDGKNDKKSKKNGKKSKKKKSDTQDDNKETKKGKGRGKKALKFVANGLSTVNDYFWAQSLKEGSSCGFPRPKLYLSHME